MPTTRRIYASEAIYIGPSPATGNHRSSGASGDNQLVQLLRVQSFSHDANITRQNVNQFGRLAAISREIIDPPVVNVNCTYLTVNANNESGLGFITDGTVSAFSGIINGTTDDRNIFSSIAENDEDNVDNTSANNTYVVEGFGNAFLNSYAVEGAVGGLPQATLGWEANNYEVYLNKTGQHIPALHPTSGSRIFDTTFDVPAAVTGAGVAALRPGDITITITGAAGTSTGIGIDISDTKVTSYNINVPLVRNALNKLGSVYPYARKIQFPQDITTAIAMDVGDYVTGSLAAIVCNDNPVDVTVTLRKPSCAGTVGPVALIYKTKNAKLDTQSSNLATDGAQKNITMNFTSSVSNAEDLTNGFYLSGLKES